MRPSRAVGLVVVVFLTAGSGCGGEGVPPAGLDVLVVSDSNGASPGAWPERVARELQAAQAPLPVRLFNDSRPGRTWAIDRGGFETAAHLGMGRFVARIADETDGQLDFVVLCLGTNDAQRRFGGREFGSSVHLAGIGAALDAASAAAPGATLVVVTPPPVCPGRTDARADADADARWQGAEPRIERLADHLAEQAALRGAILIDATVDLGIPPCDAVGADGVHLSDGGHAAMADLVLPALVSPRR